MFKQHEKQYTKAAATLSDKKSEPQQPGVPSGSQPLQKPKQRKPAEASTPLPTCLCYVQQPGNFARQCPKKNKREAPVRLTKVESHNSSLEAKNSQTCDDLTDEQVETS